ncbi:SLAC1 anion channel family protein [Pelomonas sp. KK5]|uniref:SLAC1 anion channel family protein n=1 Tax=Pelomonas sp. KK5 TaxID=1855730 RepID=UPI0009F84708|nr:SLAC1 anion channel family protein [Pelomonas sp. KK5]
MSQPPASSPIEAPPAAPSLAQLPVNLFAAVMGLSGLALAWRLVQAQYGFGGGVAEGVGALAVAVFLGMGLGYLAKVVRHPSVVKAEFGHPVVGNFFGTVSISLLLVSAVLRPHAALLGEAVWVAGCVVTLALAYVVVGRLLRGQADPAHALPAWLIPGVATLDIPVTGAHMPMPWAGELMLFAAAIGAVLALAMFTMIASRLIHHAPLPEAMRPSLMILVAPFEVGFLAYVNLVGDVDRFAGLLFYFGLFMFVVLAPKVFRRGVAFGPGWWAIGFPIAALANAALKYAAVHPGPASQALAGLLLAFLSLALAVLCGLTLRHAGRTFILSRKPPIPNRDFRLHPAPRRAPIMDPSQATPARGILRRSDDEQVPTATR